MRGYFGIGVEGVSKIRNVGALMRTAHAFDASFVFVIAPSVNMGAMQQTDTSETAKHVPFFIHQSLDDLNMPKGCQLVGIELTDDAVELPSFRHPDRAAYILGPEAGSLSQETQARCDHIIKIPTRFCVNLSVAGAIVLYDRLTSLGRFPVKPVTAGGPIQALPDPVHGGRRRQRRKRDGDAAPNSDPESDPNSDL